MLRSSVALNNLRACAILSLLAFHSVLAYLGSLPASPFPFDRAPFRWTAHPIIDSQRWFGFDIFCAFQDIYLMSLMFFLSGVFIWPSLARKGETAFLQGRFLRLCVPAALAVLLLMPLAHYATYSVTAVDPGVAAFWAHWSALPFWPSGPPWFLWQLFAFNLAAAALWAFAPRWFARLAWLASSARAEPAHYFFGLVALAALAYVPLALAFGPWRWFEYGIFAFQLSRPLHYAVFFFAGVGIGAFGLERGLLATDGALAQGWRAWLAAALACFVLWLAAMALSMQQGMSDVAAVQVAAHVAFVLSCASSCFALFALFLRFATRRSPLLGNVAENAYGMYLLHYVFVVWLQYSLLDAALPAVVKGAMVFTGVVALSWAMSSAMHRAPIGYRMIGAERRVLAKAR
jgi:peptidoglycan/LPS O-acetylase OafA/YrhL